MDNRGLISALLAVRAILKASPRAGMPTIHFLVVDASAYSPGFKQNRGLGAVAGASRKLANGLITSLFKEVQGLHERADGVQLHDLTLPKVFRMSGGFGTNWMMPTLVHLKDPQEWDKRDAKQITLTGDQIKSAFDQIFYEGKRTWPNPKIKDWIPKKDDPRIVLRRLLDRR
jgi:hypothetical protein